MNVALHLQLLDDLDAASLSMLRRVRGDAPAANEDSCIEERAGNDLQAWAWHTFGANGFGDAPISTDMAAPGSAATKLHGQAHAARSQAIVDAIAACWQFLARSLRRARERHRAYRVARETRDALRSLDDRTLRDLGYDRSEIESVATEVAMLRAQWSS
jgi:uncharacterized protein YjiS (DUF1127 family)